MNKQVHVAVGVILKAGKILIAKRALEAHQGGLWEFPGGKVEAGESVQEALTRELQEELSIEPTELEPLMEIHHEYSDKTVWLDIWLVSQFHGEPAGLEGQPIQWVAVEQLDQYEFPKANQPIIERLQCETI